MEVLRRCPLAIAQRLVHCAIALSTAVLDRVTKTMSVAPLLMNNLDNSKHKTSNLLSPAPPPYSWSLLGKSEGPAPPPSSKISWSFDLAWSPDTCWCWREYQKYIYSLRVCLQVICIKLRNFWSHYTPPPPPPTSLFLTHSRKSTVQFILLNYLIRVTAQQALARVCVRACVLVFKNVWNIKWFQDVPPSRPSLQTYQMNVGCYSLRSKSVSVSARARTHTHTHTHTRARARARARTHARKHARTHARTHNGSKMYSYTVFFTFKPVLGRETAIVKVA